MNRLGLRRRFVRGAFIASASLISIAAASPAFAQDNPAPAAQAADQEDGQEVVVTAQFREQRLQDIPLAITALPAELLEQRSQDSLVEVANQAPNVTLRQQGASFGPSIGASIRGIGQFDFSPAYEPGVGLYIDDVYYSSLTGANFELLDLERIEILRGPQGTLQGRNSVGGAIRLITRRPDGDGGGFVEASYGSRNLIGIRGGATFTIADGLYGRISGTARQQRGYVERIDYGCAFPNSGIAATRTPGDCTVSHHGGVGYTAVRGQLRYHPNPDVDVVLSGDYTRDHRTIAPEVLVATQAPGNTLNIGPAFGPQFICGRYCNYSAFAQPAIVWAGPAAPGIPLIATSGTDESTFEGWGLALNADFNVAENVQIQSITAYREWNNRFNADDDLSPSNIGFGQNALDYWFWSQELRLNAQLFEGFDITLGGYYNDQRTEYFTFQDIRYAAIPLQFIYAPNHDPVNADSWALFGTAIWRPIENLTITGGLRYTEEHKDYEFNRSNPDGSFNPFLGGLTGTVATFDGNRTDYRLSVDYRFSPEVLVYATTSTGFKGGGVGPRPFNPAQARGFGPEVLTNYELGIKTDLFDRRLRLNVAAFYAQYDGIQLALLSCPQFGGPGPCALPQNAGDAHIQGLEVEVFARPVDGLQIDGSLSWIDFTYDCVQITVVRPLNPGETDICSTDPSIIGGLGERPPALPEWKWSFGIQYEIPLGTRGTLTPRFDMSYNGATAGGVTSGGFALPSFTIANARLTWRDNDNDWQVALEVTNLFDEYYYLTSFDLRGAGAGFVKAQPGRPREWALTVTRRF
ncbi:MAG TPA: TonB-dependent receptor [Allosphingosinicella sp.]|nr:TonB-dependent receptor [Allosphingosinicella sp.]